MLCDYVAGKMPLIRACDTLGVDRRAVYEAIEKDAEFRTAMEEARAIGYDAIAEEALEIADNATLDGDGKPNKEWMQRSKLRVETRLKLLAKWHPKRYGEKLEVQSTNTNVQIPVGNDPIEAAQAYEKYMRGG